MKQQMTVGDLLDALKDIDKATPVVLEGCDCNGDLGSVEVDDYIPGRGPTVYLGRTDA